MNWKRFTPTCVGNTEPRGHLDTAESVHPHVCGEYVSTVTFTAHAVGSPPRVWGIRFTLHLTTRPSRFTPTCVGNTPPGSPPPRLRTVHPHVCGEYQGIR